MAGEGPRTIDLAGGVRVTPFVTATWRTDAAPQFGPVPKILWAPIVGADIGDDEMIAMASVALLVETPEARIVVDPGPGRSPRAEVPLMRDLDASGLDALESAVDEGPLDAVVLTDLRAEHAGALLTPGSRLAGAAGRIVAQGREWDAAHRANDRVALMVDQEGVRRLAAGATAVRVEGEATVAPKVFLVPTGGFTVGHQVVIVRGRGAEARTLAFLGGLLPRRWSTNPRWVTALDDLPLESVAAKKELFGRAVAEGWLVALSHEPGAPVGRLVADRDRFRFEPL